LAAMVAAETTAAADVAAVPVGAANASGLDDGDVSVDNGVPVGSDVSVDSGEIDPDQTKDDEDSSDNDGDEVMNDN
jgi:hypothetical protein